jgi:hypothetical protein
LQGKGGNEGEWWQDEADDQECLANGNQCEQGERDEGDEIDKRDSCQ